MRGMKVVVSALLLSAFAATVAAQSYPDRPIRIVTSGVGGGSDFTARRVVEAIAGPLGQPVIVENRGGGGAGTGGIVANAIPDGYTLLVGSNSLWIGPLFDKMPYDVVKDFAPVSTVSFSPLVLIVHPSVPVNSVKELIALGKANPGKIDYGSTAIGGSVHLGAELFKARAGVDFVRIPYKGGGDAMTATVAGQVKLMFASGAVTPLIKAGRVKALAVTSLHPSALFPGLPSIADSGLPGFEVVGLDGILATAKTPPAVIKRLNEEMVRGLNRPEVKERFFVTGLEVSTSSPQQFAAMIKSETETIGKLIKDANVKPN